MARLAQGGVNRLPVRVENEAPLHVIAHDQTVDNHDGQGGNAEDQSEDLESAAVGHWVDSCSPHFLWEYAQTTSKVRGVADFLAATFTTPPRCRGEAAGPLPPPSQAASWTQRFRRPDDRPVQLAM